MLTNLSGRQQELRALIQGFLSERLASKLEKLNPDAPQYAQLQKEFEYTTWIEDAAKRVGQIQAVTHSLKPIHPDAKGTNLFCDPSHLSSASVVGSHCLADGFKLDVVGNAAALDIYKFLKLIHQGRSLLELCVARDADLSAALNEDQNRAQGWMNAFATLVSARGNPASHTHAKQLYWLTGEDPHSADSFHLLAPLYATSLAHVIYETIQADRFSDEAKDAREARRSEQFSERPVREYPQLAVQKLGGTKPQNISQLNSERRGESYLLASLPPDWQSQGIKPLLHVDSLFHPFGRRKDVRQRVKDLLDFLKAGPRFNADTRHARDAAVMEIIDVFLQFCAEIREQEPGWSQQPTCQLNAAQRHWLDPLGSTLHEAALPDDTEARIAEAFANWLNAQLRDPLPMGDPEFLHWRKLILEEIKAEDWEEVHEPR